MFFMGLTYFFLCTYIGKYIIIYLLSQLLLLFPILVFSSPSYNCLLPHQSPSLKFSSPSLPPLRSFSTISTPPSLPTASEPHVLPPPCPPPRRRGRGRRRVPVEDHRRERGPGPHRQGVGLPGALSPPHARLQGGYILAFAPSYW